MKVYLPLLGLLLHLQALPAFAQTPSCDALDGEKKQQAEKILSSQHPYDCCDDTIAACLRQQPVCRLAWRLAESVCRQVAAGRGEREIVRALSRRARSMMPGGRAARIALEGVPPLGQAGAPVVVVEYACARCPFCAVITPRLVEAVRSGPLAGKVRLYYRLFPIRSHEYSKQAALAFAAAAELGRFWDYLLLAYRRFDSFCPLKQADWAAELGLDKQEFSRLLQDQRLVERVVRSKKEGIVNGVQATPTFFINGRKYLGEMDYREMVDVLEEEYDRLQGLKYREADK